MTQRPRSLRLQTQVITGASSGIGLAVAEQAAAAGAQARRLVDTNFWGVVHGSLAAAAHLRRKGGTLINMASITADHAVPLQTVYSASKHAVRGFTEGLRQELMAGNWPMAVVLAKPACIASPLIEHVAHPAGRKPRLVSPLYAPRDAALAILEAAVRPQRVVEIGGAAVLNGIASVGATLRQRCAPVQNQHKSGASCLAVELRPECAAWVGHFAKPKHTLKGRAKWRMRSKSGTSTTNT